MPRTHEYDVRVTWTGNRGSGTSGYREFERAHDVTADGVPPIAASADPALRGDPSRWNPEQLLLAALSECHMLWYLHLCAGAGVVVTGYTDDAHATMIEHADGGRFTEAVLRPRVTVTSAEQVVRAEELHAPAGERCFIANSVAFPVRHEPTIVAP